ncbi:hypothetical protein [Actinomycetospora sp. TBRC 11914]|uniref:hypothetical protein n=1 Tax=Actinomycetospora sp. TBRC 11914 TaxID=2729387 RepID=UPI00145F37AE|nr:hypothetical protein [Actinomycetospora sp. TBRC 11914]NMO90345.1 hypothetical protein [Actinomycetospora sp. TBRC 11914]
MSTQTQKGPTHNDGHQARVPHWLVALLLMAAGIALIDVGFLYYSSRFAGKPPDLPGLQLAGSVEAVRKTFTQPSATYTAALAADYWLIGAYTLGLVLLTLVGGWCFAGPRARLFARVAVGTAVVAGLLDVVENLAVTWGLEQLTEPQSGELWWRVAASADVLKLVLLLPTVAVALATVLMVGARAAHHPTAAPVTVEPGSLRSGDPSNSLPPSVAKERFAGEVGVCVSGGGIRSACVTLGALQMLRAAGKLTNDGYLFSVSGGGYMAGALRLAMQAEHTGDANRANRNPPLYEQGTAELRHMRDHGNYVAQGCTQWMVALGVVLAHLVYVLFLLAAASVAVGLVLGFLYRQYPLAGPGVSDAVGHVGHDPGGVTWLLGTLVALTVFLWIAAGAREGLTGAPSPAWRRTAWVPAGITLLVAVVTLVVPWLAWWVGNNNAVAQTTAAIGAALTAISSVAAMGTKLSPAGGTSSATGRFTRYLMPVGVVVVVALLIVAMLIVMAWTVAQVSPGLVTPAPVPPATVPPPSFVPPPAPTWLLISLAVGVLVAALAALTFDQTTASLHPFYRQRMNTVFATRRRENGSAAPYDYAERTALSCYAKKVEGFPALVFVATAQVSAGPGKPTRPVPYTFSGDWVGGAQLGYVRTEALDDRVPRCYRGDLTVLGAMALSGAAFASAMGVMSKPFEVLLALSNARLGAWLPNPWWLRRESQDAGSRDWTRRRLPAVRGESYHLREILGSHPLHDPLVLVTDGGHYDNLGLVEALRHRCATIIVVDSSGDAPPYATALLEAIRLAHEELGVTVDLKDPDDLAPGSVLLDDPLPEPLKDLLPRLSKSALVRGTITYPTPLPSGTPYGRLVVVKTRLVQDLPYEVFAYAHANPDFPYDSTADQWFDRDQFDAYHNLGRRLGEIAADALDDPNGPSPNGSSPPPITTSVIDWTLIMQGRWSGDGGSAVQPQG